MEEFIARENIRNFRAQLEDCSDEAQKETLMKLLRDEEQHLEAIVGGRTGRAERARS